MNFLDWFHHFSNFWTFVVVALVIVLPVAFAPYLGQRVLRFREDKERSDGALDAFKAIVSFTAFLLAFSFVQVQGTLRNVEERVSKEATAILVIDRVLFRIGDARLSEARQSLRQYGEAIVSDEWPRLADNLGGSEKVETAYSGLSRAVRSFEPGSARQQGMYNELLRTLDELQDMREQRLSDAGLTLSSLFWSTIAALIVVMFGLALLISPTVNRAIVLGGLVAAVSLLLSLVIIVDAPFSGETSVSPAAIVKVLDRNARRN
ncbi:MAG TPA: DUF4239 domain-containing protein [Stellaceae bacterium]|nr:DUF4239 domain-containing protein [Stellaceae bacterium]